MKTLSSLSNETKRLDALYKIKLLDTPIEERFDRITRLACRLLNVPIAAFTLVDDTRQTFKSAQGIALGDVARELSFCTHAIRGDDVMVVPDARNDVRFANNPAVTGSPHIGFYAGVPIRADGAKIGVLCAIDHKPRMIDPEGLGTLRDLAAIVETELRATSLSDHYNTIAADLDAAERRSMLDPLTHLLNREATFRLLNDAWNRAMAKKSGLGIVIADIDGFRAINDTFGYDAGDTVLRDVSRQIISGLREENNAGRIGADEFMLILHDCSNAILRRELERVSIRLRQAAKSNETGQPRLSVSMGAIAMVPDAGFTLDTCLRTTYEALAMAKHEGGGRFEIF